MGKRGGHTLSGHTQFTGRAGEPDQNSHLSGPDQPSTRSEKRRATECDACGREVPTACFVWLRMDAGADWCVPESCRLGIMHFVAWTLSNFQLGWRDAYVGR